jgi:hypothetical protein
MITHFNPILTGGDPMIVHRLYWIMALLLGLWLAFTPVALAGGGQENFTIRIGLDRTFVAPGDAINVTGSGAEPGTAVAVLIVPDPSSGANSLASLEVTPGANGAFATTISVPGTATTGRYAVRAEQPPRFGGLVRQYAWAGICVNECTGETLGSMLPTTGGPLPGGGSLPILLSGLLVSALAVRGVGRAVRISKCA